MWSAFELGSIPAAAMFVFSLIGLNVAVDESVTGAFQHFAAGLVLCTIGTELLPSMEAATGLHENLAVIVGFGLGVALMIALGVLIPETEDDGDDDSDEENPRRNSSLLGGSNRLRRKSRGYVTMARDCADCARSASAESSAPEVAGERRPLNPSPGAADRGPFPAVLVSAIAIDGMVDGLLIGIATAAGSSAGLMMAASLSVEMGFLGITLSVALGGQEKRRALAASLVGPTAIILGSVLGGILAAALSHNPIYLTALLSFGTSALLYMVAEELLLEAHEESGHVWWVDLQLYVGFYASILMGKAVK